MTRAGNQPKLFDLSTSLPSGFIYRPDFLTPDEEADLLGYIEDLPFENAVDSEGRVARRRLINFGWSYNFATGALVPGPALPPWLQGTARKVAKWLDVRTDRVAEALLTEYQPGTAIGWHRDNEQFESIIGISLAGWCRLRLRPIRSRGRRQSTEVTSLELEPRSAYVMQHESRWNYQHSISPTRALRYSITFRTLPRKA